VPPPIAANGSGVAQVDVEYVTGAVGAGAVDGAGAGAEDVLPPGTGMPGGSQPPL
jgi:hypothetical protein